MMRFICFSALLFWAGTQVQGQLLTGSDVAITTTERGQVQGYLSNDIFTFKGIPYGQAERFAAATKPEDWQGVRSSRTYGPVAPLLSPTQADDFVAAVSAAYPEKRVPSDLIDVDVMFRMGAVAQANNKAKISGGAPVYMYLFTWQSPVMGGKYKSIHCLDVPFAFNTIDRARNMTGATPEAHALAAYVSQAWINFARFGNPTQAGLPSWKAYTPEIGATMMLDNECKVQYHPDKALLDFHRKANR